MSSSPPTLSRQNSSTGVIAFEAMSPQMQRQMSFSAASHSIIPQQHLTAQVCSPKPPQRAVVEERKTYSIPSKAATDRYLNSLLTRTRGTY